MRIYGYDGVWKAEYLLGRRSERKEVHYSGVTGEGGQIENSNKRNKIPQGRKYPDELFPRPESWSFSR